MSLTTIKLITFTMKIWSYLVLCTTKSKNSQQWFIHQIHSLRTFHIFWIILRALSDRKYTKFSKKFSHKIMIYYLNMQHVSYLNAMIIFIRFFFLFKELWHSELSEKFKTVLSSSALVAMDGQNSFVLHSES